MKHRKANTRYTDEKGYKLSCFLECIGTQVIRVRDDMGQAKASTRIDIPGVSVGRSGKSKEVGQASEKDLSSQHH